jgi:hypothetical protein
MRFQKRKKKRLTTLEYSSGHFPAMMLMILYKLDELARLSRASTTTLYATYLLGT